MRTHLVAMFGLTLATALGAAIGCGAEVDPTAAGEETAVAEESVGRDAISGDVLSAITPPRYYTVRRDLRRCRHPICGGWYVTEVNAGGRAVYVSTVDLSRAGLGEGQLDMLDAPDQDLVLRGMLGVPDEGYQRTFTVLDAYRGMPGFAPAPGDGFYTVRCRTEACRTATALLVDTTFRDVIDGVSVDRVLAPLVQEDWLVDRVVHHDAVVAGHLSGAMTTNDVVGSVLEASQVFVHLPMTSGPCLLQHHVCWEGRVPTFARDADLCLQFEACVDPGICPMVEPACAEGYRLASWPAGPDGCLAFACDPAF